MRSGCFARVVEGVYLFFFRLTPSPSPPPRLFRVLQKKCDVTVVEYYNIRIYIMYIHILHACLGVYRCRSVGHFHVVGLFGVHARVRTFAGFFFLFSPRCSVPWEKKKERFSSSTAAVDCCLPPLPRSSCSTYATRPCLPAAKQRSARPPPSPPLFSSLNGVSKPLLLKPPPSRTHTPPTFQELWGWGGSRCLVGLSGRRPAEAVFRRAHVS